jgi:hypothetical protein
MLGTTELVGTGLTVGDDVGLDVGLLVDGLVVGNNVGFAVAPTEQSVTVASFIVGLISLARFTIMFLTSTGDKVLLLARIPTAIPATSKRGNENGQIIGWRSLVEYANNLPKYNLRGLAMLVPLVVFVAVSEVLHADRTPEPGAKMSTQHVVVGQKLLKDDFASLLVVDPTVIALDDDAGEKLQAS